MYRTELFFLKSWRLQDTYKERSTATPSNTIWCTEYSTCMWDNWVKSM